MEPIIEPVSRSLLLAELTPERKVRNTNKASNEIYIFDAAECPSLLREIGRLREVAFRSAGGGTGLAVDIDEEDLAGDGYYQLIVWDPAEQEIVGGYRFIVCTSEIPGIFPLNIISPSATNSARNTCPIPSNWGVRSYSLPISRAAIRRVSMRWTTSGTVWGRLWC